MVITKKFLGIEFQDAKEFQDAEEFPDNAALDDLAAFDGINELLHSFDELEDALDTLDEADFARLTSSNARKWGRKLTNKVVHVVKKGYEFYEKCKANVLCNAVLSFALKVALSG